MINFNEYNNFVYKNENLTKCQKKIFIEYRKNLGIIYKGRKSNIQLKTLFSNIYKNNLINKLTKITLLFYAFYNLIFTDELINLIKITEISDKEFINFVLEKQQKDKSLFISERRTNKHLFCNEWTYIIQNLIQSFKKINKNNDITYLDLGCGNGNKTTKIAEELGISIKNTYGADLKQWGPYKQEKINHKFNFIEIINNELSMPDNSFDFISCILMLHHVKDLDKIIKEIKRLLKPDGILLIIEHNNYDDYDNMTLDILHMFYGYLYDNNKNYLEHPDYAQYYNWLEWDYIINKFGFTYLKSNLLFTELSNEIRYDNVFYCFYKNIK